MSRKKSVMSQNPHFPTTLCKIRKFATLALASYFLRSDRYYNEAEVWHVRFFTNNNQLQV